MSKLKITKVNLLLLIVVLLLTIIPEIIVFILQKSFGIDISNLIQNNETAKIITLIINEYGFVLIPVIIFGIANWIDIKKVFRLNFVGIPAMLLTIIMAASIWVISQFVTIVLVDIYNRIFGSPSNEIVDLMPQLPIWGFFLIAFTPAICEEALFRGVVLKAYENLGTFRAIVFSAVFFSMVHISALRFVGPLFIGLLSGYLVVRSNSIIPGIITHFTFNGISLGLFYMTKIQPQETPSTPTILQYILLFIMVLFAAALLAVCLLAYNYFTQPKEKRKNPEATGGITELLLFNRNSIEQIRFKKPIRAIWRDVAVVITHWPIVIIILIVAVINISEMLILLLEKILNLSH